MTPSPTTKTLTVVRHSKAQPEAATDRERPLAPRGLRDAGAAGQWLAGRPTPPAVALVSGAVRARQTWEAMSSTLGAVDTRVLDDLYEASVDSVIETLHLLDEADISVAVVGHNLTMQQLVWDLSDGRTPAHADLAGHGFPTSAIAVLEYSGRWLDLGPDSCALAAFHVGRG